MSIHSNSQAEPRLYLVTQPHPNWFTQVSQLLENGVSIVQIRDKVASDDNVARNVERVLNFVQAKGLSTTVLLNDRVHLAKQFGIGVHLGQSDMSPAQARIELGGDLPIGWTIHDDVACVEQQVEHIDYVGVGPIFPTTTKLDTKSVLGVERLATVCRTLSVPVVAIGGIQADNIQSVREAKPWAIAMSSALMHCTPDQFYRFLTT